MDKNKKEKITKNTITGVLASAIMITGIASERNQVKKNQTVNGVTFSTETLAPTMTTSTTEPTTQETISHETNPDTTDYFNNVITSDNYGHCYIVDNAGWKIYLNLNEEDIFEVYEDAFLNCKTLEDGVRVFHSLFNGDTFSLNAYDIRLKAGKNPAENEYAGQNIFKSSQIEEACTTQQAEENEPEM